MTVPPEAITAAAAAITRELMSGKDYSMAIDSDEALAAAALEAAAPLIAAAERNRVLAILGDYYLPGWIQQVRDLLAGDHQ